MFQWLRPDPTSGVGSSESGDDGGPAVDGDERDVDVPLPSGGEPSLAALPIAGITRRRMAAAISVLLACWIVIVFARQVGVASAATAHAEDLAVSNGELRLDIAIREREFDLIGRQRYIEQQARGYGLGTAREIAFTLAPDAPDLSADAPGSAAVRVGATSEAVTPLERWLTILFGPSD